MSTRLFNVRPYGIEYVCDQCAKGVMESQDGVANIMLSCDPPKFRHVCTVCGYEAYLTDRYPAIRWEKTDEIEKGKL